MMIIDLKINMNGFFLVCFLIFVLLSFVQGWIFYKEFSILTVQFFLFSYRYIFGFKEILIKIIII